MLDNETLRYPVFSGHTDRLPSAEKASSAVAVEFTDSCLIVCVSASVCMALCKCMCVYLCIWAQAIAKSYIMHRLEIYTRAIVLQ